MPTATEERDAFRKRFADLLAEADDEGLCRLIWAIDALQSDRFLAGAKAIGFPALAVHPTMDSPFFRFPWAMETIFNESLTHAKRLGNSRSFDWRNFEGLDDLFGTLMGLENAEYGVFGKPENVWDEMGRIAERQFPWQRHGFHNIRTLNRSMFMFGGPKSAEHFLKTYGLSLTDFVLAGFAIWAKLTQMAVIDRPQLVPELGFTADKYEKAVSILSRPLESLRSAATAERAPYQLGAAYRPSVLRKHPCVSFDNGTRLRAPLIELIINRVNAGLYYDLVADEDSKNEFANRFVEYARELLAATFPETEWRPEELYGRSGEQKRTPDILMGPKNGCRLVIECKASRMGAAALFNEDPLVAAERGFKYIAKGVEQIWRYFSHVRQGLISGHAIANDAFGVVLTLDPWLRMSRDRYAALIKIATKIADEKGGIEPMDRKPVAFAAIDDFEELLRVATLDSFLATLRDVANEERGGRFLANWHREGKHAPNPLVRREYPLADRVVEFLPWWDKLDQIRPTGD